jgi:hypothetical protein
MKFSKSVFPLIHCCYSALFSMVGLLVFMGCRSGDEDMSIINPNPDDFVVRYTDTLQVDMATVPMDSILTDGVGRLLAGSYQDPYLGIVKSIPYMQMELRSRVSPPDKSVYDSLVLSLPYEYYYGDTTRYQTFYVHLLTEDISKKIYYNNNSVPYDPSPIATVRFKPRPNSNKPLYIRLSDELGRTIFEQGKQNKVGTKEEFLELLKGIALVPDETLNSAILGFTSSNDSAAVNLYHHVNQADGRVTTLNSFRVVKAFNQTICNRAGTPLAALGTSSKTALSSSLAGNMSFIQNGAGLKTRIDIPYVKKLKTIGNVIVNRAFLRVEPVKLSVGKYITAPPILSLYYCNKNNQMVSQVMDLSGNAVTATFVEDVMNNKSYYQFDISEYIIALMAEESDLMTNGLLVSPSADIATTFTRVVFGDQKNGAAKTELDVYYTYIKE